MVVADRLGICPFSPIVFGAEAVIVPAVPEGWSPTPAEMGEMLHRSIERRREEVS